MWYAAHIIMYVKFKDVTQTKYPVWENLYLIEAENDNDALEKAKLLGKEDEGDSDGTFRWDDKPAEWVFGGIRKIIKCDNYHEKPVPGTELSYSEFLVNNEDDLNRLIKGDSVDIKYIE